MQTNQSSEQPVGPQVGTNLGAQPGAQAGNQANPQAEAKQPAFNSASVQSAADLITAKLGLEKIEGFSLKAFFSEVFSRSEEHTSELQSH